MARGPLHTFSLARQSKAEQQAAREACVLRIRDLLAIEPRTAAELVAALHTTRGTMFGYLRYMHKVARTIRPLTEERNRAMLWALGADPELLVVGESVEFVSMPKRPTGKARQIGMQRHWMDVALFGPAAHAA